MTGKLSSSAAEYLEATLNSGSAWGDWSLYTDSPLRAFEDETGVLSWRGLLWNFDDPLFLFWKAHLKKMKQRWQKMKQDVKDEKSVDSRFAYHSVTYLIYSYLFSVRSSATRGLLGSIGSFGEWLPGSIGDWNFFERARLGVIFSSTPYTVLHYLSKFGWSCSNLHWTYLM